MKIAIPVTAIWLRGSGENKVQVLVEINDKWHIAIEEHIDTTFSNVIPVSYIAEGNGRSHWKEEKDKHANKSLQHFT